VTVAPLVGSSLEGYDETGLMAPYVYRLIAHLNHEFAVASVFHSLVLTDCGVFCAGDTFLLLRILALTLTMTNQNMIPFARKAKPNLKSGLMS
jgi:hypothetical protein